MSVLPMARSVASMEKKMRDITPKLAAPGQGGVHTESVARQIGADAYLPKPFEIDELLMLTSCRERAELNREEAASRDRLRFKLRAEGSGL